MSEKFSVGIVGNGITGKASTLELSKRFGEDIAVTIYDNYHPSHTTRPIPPSHLGPIGLEVQSGNLWNAYEFGDSYGGLYCNVKDEASAGWLKEFARRSVDEGVEDRQVELYAYNYEGLEKYLSDPDYASHIAQIGNLRLFRSDKALARASRYLTRIIDLYETAPIVLEGSDAIVRDFPEVDRFHVDDYAGAIFYPEDATGDSLKIQDRMSERIHQRGINIINTKVAEIEAASNGATILSGKNKRFKHDLVLLCAGIVNEQIAGIDPDDYWLYPFAGRRLDLSPVDELGLGNVTVGLDDECFILRQATDGRIQVGGTVIIRDRELYRHKLWYDDIKKDDFVEKVLSERLRSFITTLTISYGTRAMTQDDLPSIRNPHGQESILMVNPTGHLGFLQAPAMANRAAEYTAKLLDVRQSELSQRHSSDSLELSLRKMYRKKGPKPKSPGTDEKPAPRRGSRSNFIALRKSIIESGRGNAKKPMPKEQKLARRRKRH